MASQAKEEWEKAMAELAQEEPDLLQHFHKLSEAAGKVGKNHPIFTCASLMCSVYHLTAVSSYFSTFLLHWCQFVCILSRH